MLFDGVPKSKMGSDVINDNVKQESCILCMSVGTATILYVCISAQFTWIEKLRHNIKHVTTTEDTAVKNLNAAVNTLYDEH